MSSQTPITPLANESGERRIAADVLFPALGKELVEKLTGHLPTDRMSQDHIHEVMEMSGWRFQTMLHEQTPNSSEPLKCCQQDELVDALRERGLEPVAAQEAATAMQRDMDAHIKQRKAELSERYQQAAIERPYERLRQRESVRALSLTPSEDVQQIIEALELPHSTAIRFEKAYTQLVKEQHKMHVAAATLEPFIFGVATPHDEHPGNRLIAAKEKRDELMDTLATMLYLSETTALPAGNEREAAAHRLVTRILYSSHSPQEPPSTAPIRLDETSDYRFAVSVRRHISTNPEAGKAFDEIIGKLQHMADEVLDPHKVTEFTVPLIHKQAKNLANLLESDNIPDSHAIAARIAKTFTKQVDLVQSKARNITE